MTTQHPSARRTRLPILIAAWLFIIAATVTMSSGLPRTAQAQAERGAIPSLNLASSEPGQLVITWETPDPAPTDYRLRWAPATGDFLSYKDVNEVERGNLYPLGDVTTLTVDNLTPGDSYKVQMRSRYYNADRSVHESSGPWTNTATQRVKDHPPTAPTGLIAARIGHSVLTLTWDDPQDDTITGYRVLRGTEADNLAVINSDTASNATEYEDDTVAPETAYHYAVLARSANGEGAQSDIISATTPAAPKSKEQPRRSGARQDTPIPPVILVSNLSQTANQNATYSRDHGQAFTTGNNSTGYSVTSVTIVSRDPNNDPIPLQICEVDGSVHPTTVCTDLTPPSSYPQGNLTYTVPTTTPLTLDADTTYMLVFKAPPSGLLRVAATSSDDQDPTSLTGFSIANAFQWYNTSNTWVIGNFSRAILITITGKVNQTAPGAPTDLSATARGSTKINLSWTAPDGSDITGYKIESSSDAGSNWTDLVADTGNTNTAYQHTGLSRGDTRHYRVSAINSVGTSAPSNTANATTATVTDTTAPTVTSITPQDPTSSPTNSDNLTWRVTFSEAVENVDPADFMVTGTTATLTVTEVTNLTGVYDVTASGGDLASVDGTVTLAFAGNQNIADPENNTLTATTPTGANDPTFELDNTVPTFVSGTANGTLIVLTFSEELDPNSLPPGSAFNISTDSNVTANSVSIEGTMVTLTVTPAIVVDQTVDVNNNAYAGTGTVPLKDFAGNEVQPAAIVGSYRVTNETPIGPPASLRAPRNLAARAQDEGITAWWQIPPAGDERAPVTSYKVRYRQVGMGTSPWQNLTRANDDRSATQEINNLTNRQHYQVQVAAVNRVGTGQWASVKATPQAPDSPLPDPTGDAALTLGILGLFWDNSTTGNTLWADTCTGPRSFLIIWDGPKGHDRAADEWAAHINTNRGAGVVTYSFRETPNHPGYYEMYGTVNFEGNGSLSVNVRGRFGETWATWSPTGSLYCYTTEKPSRN